MNMGMSSLKSEYFLKTLNLCMGIQVLRSQILKYANKFNNSVENNYLRMVEMS